MNNPSIWSYFFSAGPIVKLVMLLLIAASIASWTVIFERIRYLKKTKAAVDHFEKLFWSSDDLSQFYKSLQQRGAVSGLSAIFVAGFKEFLQLNQPGIMANHVMSGAKRAMRVAQIRENEKLESYLPLLATIGSVSPYVGLFGTVWGIMAAFSSLSQVSEASIAMVAPGISEALVATALGLFAAIPAVIGYNRFVQLVDRLLNRFEAFEDEFASLLYRHTQKQHKHSQGLDDVAQ
jgi:biopolymer transport protein TolQ